MGYSYGTTAAMTLAQGRPEWLRAYVGVGQSGTGGGEAYLYQCLLALAAEGNDASET